MTYLLCAVVCTLCILASLPATLAGSFIGVFGFGVSTACAGFCLALYFVDRHENRNY